MLGAKYGEWLNLLLFFKSYTKFAQIFVNYLTFIIIRTETKECGDGQREIQVCVW